MFNFFKKISNKIKSKKKFVIILSAGRSGSSYLLNELNKLKGVNIYGENFNTFSKIIKTIYGLKKTIENSHNSNKISKVNDLEKYKEDQFIYVEWYNDISKLKKITVNLENALNFYFKGGYNVCGFKEIRFQDKENIQCLQYFEKKYDVYYIHIIRDVNDQSVSGFWKNTVNSKERIIKINTNIEEVLGKKNKYIKVDLSDIKDDISIVREFIEI